MKAHIKLVVIVCTAIHAAGCATNPYKANEVETKIEPKGTFMGSTIGLNEKKEIVVQTETAADVELRETRWRTYDLERIIATAHEDLTRCREELADPRIGGNGQVVEIPEIDSMRSIASVKEELGITENGSLSIVRKEMFIDKLQQERKYEQALQATAKTLTKYRTQCEREMGYARVKHGLPSKRYVGQGYYEAGRYVQTRGAEHSLDDAFRIASSESGKFQTSVIAAQADATESAEESKESESSDQEE